MKATGHWINEGLAVMGGVLVILVALPIAAAVFFVLRGVALATLVVALAAGLALWLTSARFRTWWGAVVVPEEAYKGLRLATDVAVHPGHAWARVHGTRVTIGADDLVPVVLGPVQAVELPPAGREVARGDPLFRVRREDRVIEMPAPVSGVVVAGNRALARTPALINQDPFRRGWAVRLRGTPALGHERQRLRRGDEAQAWFRDEVDRLLSTVLGDAETARALADGGALSADLYRRIDDGAWGRVTAALGGRGEGGAS